MEIEGVVPQRLACRLKETAAILGICERNVRWLMHRGLIPSCRALRHILIPGTEIERVLRENVTIWFTTFTIPELAPWNDRKMESVAFLPAHERLILQLWIRRPTVFLPRSLFILAEGPGKRRLLSTSGVSK